MGQLVSHTDERPPGVEGLRQHVEQRAATLEELEQAAVTGELVGPQLVEHAGRTAHEQTLLLLRYELGERRPQRLDERTLARGQARIGQALLEQPRPELDPGQLLVQVLA